MSANQTVKNRHAHMRWLGVLGVAAGAVLMIYLPSQTAISRTVLFFAGFHLVGSVVLLSSLYVVRGYKWVGRFYPKAAAKDDGYNFGWAPAWTHGPWIAALVLMAIAAAIQIAAPTYWPLSTFSTLFAASFFAGGLFARSASSYEDAVLPMVDLLPDDDEYALVLDAGCGSGRTTVSLSRAVKRARIIALDRFDSDYIEAGGRTLLERNLLRAGISTRTQIRVGDLTFLPCPDKSFDAAVSAHAVDHLGSMKEEGLRQIFRVLKPGARFLLIVWVPGWTMFSIANVLSFRLDSPQAWRNLAKKAGFRLEDEGKFNGNWFALLEKPKKEQSAGS